jgi:hypothetical protein
MSGAANHGTYSNPGMGSSPWGPGPAWNQSAWNQSSPPGWGYWHWWTTLPPSLRIVAVVLGFILWWPVGLALLLVSLWRGRMGCWGHYRRGSYQGAPWQASAGPWAVWRNWCSGGERPAPTSGNRAFDEYRMETLRRLEEEQKEFGAFLDRLRFAKDKAEFDQFMTELRQRPPAPPEQPQAPPPPQG